ADPHGQARERRDRRRRVVAAPPLREQVPERAERLPAVADPVLLLGGELGHGPGVAVGHEDRVVAEPALAARLGYERARARGVGGEPPDRPVVADGEDLADLAGVPRGYGQPLGEPHPASAARWISTSSPMPAEARSTSRSRCSRENGSPSAVPCTSTSLPEPVITT